MNVIAKTFHSDPSDFVASLAKGLSVLRIFGRDRDALTLSDVAREADLSRAAARRFLLTLQALGYVASDGKYFTLTSKVLELGFSYLSSKNWISVASPLMEDLRNQLGESVSATVLEGSEVVYVARFRADRVLTMSVEIGTRRPAYCTAMGRVLLAHLPDTLVRQRLRESDLRAHTPQTLTDVNAIMAKIDEVRAKGYALIDRELERGLVAISVPLKTSGGKTFAALNVCRHDSYGDAASLVEMGLEPLLRTAAQISRSIV